MENAACQKVQEQLPEAEILRDREHSRIKLVCLSSGEKRIIRQYDHPVTAYQALLGADCPQLPKVFSYSETESGCTVEEEYIEGCRLFELLCQNLPTEVEACAWTKDVCAALRLLHSLGLVHRDVKPENIIIRPDGTAVLLDLDAASALLSEKNTDTQLLGTVGYAAPEQFGFARSDMRTDIFSVGVLLNILLTGEHPSVRLADGPMRPVIEKCISVNAGSRYSTVAEFLQALEAPRNTGKKKGFRIWWPALAVLLICCAAVWFFLRPGDRVPDAAEDAGLAPEETTTPNTVHRYILDPPEGSTLLQTQVEPFTGELCRCVNFEYDADGDGKTEHYLFAGGVVANNQLFMIGDSIGDSPLPGDNGFYMAPMVWKQDGDSNRWIPAEEMAGHIKNPTVTLYSIEAGEGIPLNYPLDDLYGIWKGSVYSIHKLDSIGIWVYQFSAEIDGTEYRTASQCTITDW